jgi:hypothetical protein
MLVLAYVVGFFAALFLLLAGAAWLRVARSPRDPLPASLVRPAAWATGLAFVFLGTTLLIAAANWAGQKKLQAWGSPDAEDRQAN